jgi:membrane protein required for colicin V production
MNIAIIDIVFFGIVAICTLRCAVRGFVSELMSMAAMILGLFTSIFFFRSGAAIIRGRFLPGMIIVPEIIAFVLLFLIVFAAAKLVEMVLKSIIEAIQFGGADRFLGILFGFAEGIVIVCLLLFVINIQPFFDPAPLLRGSFFAELLLPFILGTRQEVLDSIVLLGDLPGGRPAHV